MLLPSCTQEAKTELKAITAQADFITNQHFKITIYFGKTI